MKRLIGLLVVMFIASGLAYAQTREKCPDALRPYLPSADACQVFSSVGSFYIYDDKGIIIACGTGDIIKDPFVVTFTYIKGWPYEKGGYIFMNEYGIPETTSRDVLDMYRSLFGEDPK